MYSKIKLFGHPVHPMLVAFPVAFYTATLVSYAVYGISGDPFWFRFAVITNWAGIVMAAVAALPGFIDWLIGIPRGTPAKATGLTHMLLNVCALGVFFVNGLLQVARWNDLQPPATIALALSAIGVGLTLPAGFFGWKLVQRHHVGVDLTPEQERLEPAARTSRTEAPKRPFRPAQV